MRPIVSAAVAAVVTVLLTAGCTETGVDTGKGLPQNEGANADVKGVVHLRNAFLLDGQDPASPAPQQALYAVIINNGGKPDQLQRVTVNGGGSVQLTGAVNLPPNQAVGTNEQPIGTVSGIKGNEVPMTFSFRDAGNLSVIVPVKIKAGQYGSLSPSPSAPPTPAPPGNSPANSPATSPTKSPGH